MIDGKTEDLRQIYETTENDFNLQVQKALQGKNKTWLKKKLNEANKRSIFRVKKASGNNDKIIKDTIKNNEKLYKSALRSYSSGVLKISRLTRTLGLKQAIFKQTQVGIDKGLKIRVGGRKWSYKAYNEMNVRTTLQQELGREQLKTGKENDVVFYICDSFADCADDHKDFQGKIYYDERFEGFGLDNTKEIKKFIRTKKMRSVQDVRENEPYLTTRPNCRHRLHAISTKKAMGESRKTILKEGKWSTGSYKPKNYKELQEQRYNERMIRKYKERSAMNKELGYDEQAKADSKLISKWQFRQRELIKANPELQRDLRRESNKILITDLGVRYNS